MMRVAAKGSGHALVQLLLDREDGLAGRQARAITDAEDMRVDGEGFLTKGLSLIHISEPTRLLSISYAVFCLKKKK